MFNSSETAQVHNGEKMKSQLARVIKLAYLHNKI